MPETPKTPAEGLSMQHYLAIPIDSARQVGISCSKDIVVILGWDRQHQRLHTTTWGRNALDKEGAAQLGEVVTQAALPGLDAGNATCFEDFRDPSTSAKNAAAIEDAKQRIAKLVALGQELIDELRETLEELYGEAEADAGVRDFDRELAELQG